MERVGQTLNRTGHHGSGNATDLMNFGGSKSG